MSNPARDLLAIFNSWQEAGGSSVNSRAPQDSAGIATIIRAMDLIAQIRRQLDHLVQRGIEVGIYLIASDEWARATIASPNGWNPQDANGTTALHQNGKLDMLEALAIYFDGLPPAINEGQLVNLRAYIDEIVALLGEDASIDDALRAYISNLLNEIRTALDRYETGTDFDAAEAVERLWIGLRAAAGTSKGHKKAWDGLARRILAPAASGLLAGAPMLAIEAFKLVNGIH